MGMIKSHIEGLIFGFSFFIMIVLTGIITDKIDITFNKSLEHEYNACQKELTYFEEQQHVICKAETPSFLLPTFLGFIFGGISLVWLMFYGYPIFKNKIMGVRK